MMSVFLSFYVAIIPSNIRMLVALNCKRTLRLVEHHLHAAHCAQPSSQTQRYTRPASRLGTELNKARHCMQWHTWW